MTFTTVPFSAELAAELAERERWHNETRPQRIAQAQALIKECTPSVVERQVRVLVPYITFEGQQRWRKVPTVRTFLV